MKSNIIYRQPLPELSKDGKKVEQIWLIEAEDEGYASEVGGCLIRGLAPNESLEIHAYLPEVEGD